MPIEHLQAVADAFEKWNAGDFDGAAEHFSEDCEWDAHLSALEQARTQHAHCLLAVLQLRLLVLHRDDDAGRLVGDPHRGVGRVHRLPAGSARPEDIDAQVARVDLDLGLLRFRRDEHTGGRCVNSALRLGRGHTLHAVHPALPLQP